MPPTRTSPNIIVTGTPGVGKTTHAEVLAQNTGLKHLSVNDVVKERGCHEGWDEEFGCWIVDEDKVCLWFLRSLRLGDSFRGLGKENWIGRERGGMVVAAWRGSGV
jgi:adenylate kinase